MQVCLSSAPRAAVTDHCRIHFRKDLESDPQLGRGPVPPAGLIATSCCALAYLLALRRRMPPAPGSCAEAKILSPADFWTGNVHPGHLLHHDSGVALNESRAFAEWGTLVMDSGLLDKAVEECVYGVLVMLLSSLSAMDFDRGVGAARAVFMAANNVFDAMWGAVGGSGEGSGTPGDFDKSSSGKFEWSDFLPPASDKKISSTSTTSTTPFAPYDSKEKGPPPTDSKEGAGDSTSGPSLDAYALVEEKENHDSTASNATTNSVNATQDESQAQPVLWSVPAVSRAIRHML